MLRGKARFSPFGGGTMLQTAAAQHPPAEFAMPESGALSTPVQNAPAAPWPPAAIAPSDAEARASDDLSALRGIATPLRFAQGVTLFHAGDPAEFSYEVVSGAARLCKHLADGRRQIAQFLLPGDFFSAMDASDHSFTAETITGMELRRYAWAEVEQLAERRPQVRRWLAALIVRRMHDIEQHLMMLGCRSAKERVAAFLLMLAARQDAANGATLRLPMSRQDIADFLGLSVETVSRVISALRREGVVAIPHLHEIAINDVGALLQLAENGDDSPSR